VPRGKSDGQPTPKSEQNRLLWLQTGQRADPLMRDWDPKAQPFLEALMEILSSGCAVMLRVGSGGRAVGIQIYEGDFKHQPKWIYDAEELDEWAAGINRMVQGRGEESAD